MSDSEKEDIISGPSRPNPSNSIIDLEQEQAYDEEDESKEPVNVGKPADMGAKSGVAPEGRDDDEDEQDDEEEEEEEDEDDEEEEDDDDERDARGRKRKHKKRRANRFLDVEAEVDDEEEDFEDEDMDAEAIESGFIEQDRGSPEGNAADRAAYRQFDRDEAGIQELDARELNRAIRERHRRTDKEYDGSANFTNRKANMPTPMDPRLWQVRCKALSERAVINAIMAKCRSDAINGRPVNIFSAFQRDSLPGVIFIEAHKSQHVHQALDGVLNVYLHESRNAGDNANLIGQASTKSIAPVDLSDMVALLTMKKKTTEIKEGMWVRPAKGNNIYVGDLAQITEIIPDGLTVEILLVPRIDYHPDAQKLASKRKKGLKGTLAASLRPPQRLFNKEDVTDVYGRGSVSGKARGISQFQNDEYTTKGLLMKEILIDHLKTEDVNPTLAEIALFANDADPEAAMASGIRMNLDEIAEQARKQAGSHILPGDHIEVIEGELFGLKGVVDSVAGDIVNLRVFSGQINAGQLVEAPAKSCRKVFKVGDHVKVMSGKTAGETGLVLDVAENVVTFFSDMSHKEVQAFSRDLREAAESGVTNNRVGSLQLHDLVLIDPQTAGVIFQTEREAFRVLDQNGTVRAMQPHQISSAKTEQEARRAVGLDRNDKEFRVGDLMTEVDGEGRRGNVLQIHRGIFAFLLDRESKQNSGVFVVRCKNLKPPSDSTDRSKGPDLSKMNPDVIASRPAGLVSDGVNLRKLVNLHVVIVKGTHKGLRGVIKDTVGAKLRVELGTNNKVITFDRTELKRKDARTGIVSDLIDQAGPSYQMVSEGEAAPGVNPYAMAGGATPAGMAYGMTPNPYAMGGRTPAPGFGVTPFAGGATPYGVGMGGATPFAGGRTPAYALGGATPYGAVAGLGSATPYGAGSATPYGAGAATPYAAGGYGGATPAPYAAAPYGARQGSSQANPYAAAGSSSGQRYQR